MICITSLIYCSKLSSRNLSTAIDYDLVPEKITILTSVGYQLDDSGQILATKLPPVGNSPTLVV